MKELPITLSIFLIATAATARSEVAPTGGTYTVERVIDGDALRLTS